MRGRRNKESISFLKKETKNLYSFRVALATPVWVHASAQQIKVFWFFFSKKNCFLALIL
jgi:hypothetical protein